MVRVLLDYDGTLHDCLKIYAPAFQRAYQTLVDGGLRPPKDWRPQELARWLGMSPKAMWAEFAPDLPEELREQCSQIIFQEMLRRTAGGGRSSTQVFPPCWNGSKMRDTLSSS